MCFKKLSDTFRLFYRITKMEIFTSRQLNIKNTARKKVLVLASRLPPDISGGVYRPISWAKYAQANDWNLDFLTVKIPLPHTSAGKHLQKQIPQNCNIHYVDENPITPSWTLSVRIDGNYATALDAVNTAIKIYQKEKPTAIIATGPSFDFFVTGYYLSRIFKIPLILDYRDEWSENPFSFVIQGNANRFWEKRCLNQATAVVFTTKSMQKHQVNQFNINLQKIHVIYNGWEPDEHVVLPNAKTSSSSLTLMYSGVLSKATLPGEFLADIEQIIHDQKINNTLNSTQLMIQFIGKRTVEAVNQIESFKYQKNLNIEGFLPRDIANQKMSEANALLLFTSEDMKRYLPGKLFDYIASGKPVLVHGEYGEAARIVESLDAGYFVPTGNIIKLVEVLKRIQSDSLENKNSSKKDQWLQQHSRKEMATSLFSLLNSITA